MVRVSGTGRYTPDDMFPVHVQAIMMPHCERAGTDASYCCMNEKCAATTAGWQRMGRGRRRDGGGGGRGWGWLDTNSAHVVP